MPGAHDNSLSSLQKSWDTHPKMASFLNLPVELRLHVYDYVIPERAFKVHSDRYMGLLHTCRKIRNEFEPEMCKALAIRVSRIANSIRDDANDILYTSPQTFSGWFNLYVSRPQPKDMFVREDAILHFTECCYSSLNITVYSSRRRRG